jgi:hypothetical protein
MVTDRDRIQDVSEFLIQYMPRGTWTCLSEFVFVQVLDRFPKLCFAVAQPLNFCHTLILLASAVVQHNLP